MATIKLKKPPKGGPASPDRKRPPLRGRGAQPRPTLADRQASRRADRDADDRRGPRDAGGPSRGRREPDRGFRGGRDGGPGPRARGGDGRGFRDPRDERGAFGPRRDDRPGRPPDAPRPGAHRGAEPPRAGGRRDDPRGPAGRGGRGPQDRAGGPDRRDPRDMGAPSFERPRPPWDAERRNEPRRDPWPASRDSRDTRGRAPHPDTRPDRRPPPGAERGPAGRRPDENRPREPWADRPPRAGGRDRPGGEGWRDGGGPVRGRDDRPPAFGRDERGARDSRDARPPRRDGPQRPGPEGRGFSPSERLASPPSRNPWPGHRREPGRELPPSPAYRGRPEAPGRDRPDERRNRAPGAQDERGGPPPRGNAGWQERPRQDSREAWPRPGDRPRDGRRPPEPGAHGDSRGRGPAPDRQRGPGPRNAPQHARPERSEGPAGSEAPAGTLRLSKRISELGLASRREADEWIEAGWVRVDGKVVNQLGSRVRPDQQVEVMPEARKQQAQLVTVLLHKPLGYVSGQAEDGHEPAVTLISADRQWGSDRSGLRFTPSHLRHLAPAGRLDIDSTGLLVLTQDGRIARRLIGQDSLVEKEYLVRVEWANEVDRERFESQPLAEAFPEGRLDQLRHGLELDGVELQPAKVSWQNETQLRMVLREGRKRQIRRMCELVGLKVVALKRVRIGRVVLGQLPPGEWRYLGPFESF